jgi:hypothetical protein
MIRCDNHKVVAATPTVQSLFTICFIGVADRASVVADIPLRTPESGDFSGRLRRDR